MNDQIDKSIVAAMRHQEETSELIGKLADVALPGAVFSAPVNAGDYTVVTASELYVAMGTGYGVGGGSGQETGGEEADEARGQGSGFGGGGGGGGMSRGRPVAAITIGPEGVRVDPIVDVTKVALAFFTTIGSMFLMLNRMRKASQE